MPAVEEALLRRALERYDDALALRQAKDKTAKELVELDRWYRGELRASIKGRLDGGGGHVSNDEMSRLMKWKLSRGSWRPRLQSLVDDLSPSLVLSTTKEALASYLSGSPDDALSKLSKLPGVGPATASAVLAAAWPQEEAFMSDEAMLYAVGMPKNYTPKDWRLLRSGMQERVNKEGWKDVEELERAAWAYGMFQKFGDDEEQDEVRPEMESKAGAAPKPPAAAAKRKAQEAVKTTPAEKSKKARPSTDKGSDDKASEDTPVVTTRSGRRSTRAKRE